MATRKPDWPTRLTKYLVDNQYTPFEYGRFDCLCFIAGAIAVMTGVDIMADFRGTYRSHSQAMRIARRTYDAVDVDSTLNAMMEQRGWRERMPLRAQRGDVVLVPINSGDLACGIVHPNGRETVIVTNEGLWRTPLQNAVRAWGIQ